VLHALMVASSDAKNITSRDCILPVVPMFHANAWSLAFSCPMQGAKLVMPGPKLDGASIYELLTTERVSFSAAVPTIWMMLLQHLDAHPELRLPDMKRVFIGGSACPEVIFKVFGERYGVDVIHGWGMTETSPIGSVGTRSARTFELSDADWWPIKLKQGRPVFMIDMKIVDDDNRTLPHDGKTFGRLKVKGEGASAFDAEGWFDTGDVATIDQYGYMQITDRAKDVIKSGGEWISSIDLENLAIACPGVAEAAAIGLPHPKWDERPLLVVVRRPGAEVSREQVLDQLRGKIAKWWLPDDVAFVDEIPHTATGKISKLTLRQRFKDYQWP
jgi:fatty-acyl-CoA synthase